MLFRLRSEEVVSSLLGVSPSSITPISSNASVIISVADALYAAVDVNAIVYVLGLSVGLKVAVGTVNDSAKVGLIVVDSSAGFCGCPAAIFSTLTLRKS